MIALDKEPLLSRCEHREPTCKSRLRRARSGRSALGRRPRFAAATATDEPALDTTSVRLSGSRTRQSRPDQGPGAIELYLQEIGRVPLLSAREEQMLAAKAHRGDQQAREELLKSGLRLVVSVAREHEGMGLSLFDLIAEGNLGLLKAVARFEPGRADQLSTLASGRIRQAIKRALAHYARSRRQS